MNTQTDLAPAAGPIPLRIAEAIASFFLGFCFGWGAALAYLAQWAVEPWAWFFMLERPESAFWPGVAGGLIALGLYRLKGLAPLAPLALAIPPALPFMPAWIPFSLAYQGLAVDMAWPLLTLAFFGSALNLAGHRQIPWADIFDSPRADKAFSAALPILFVAISLFVFFTGQKIKPRVGFTGDSPQYLLMADALIMDKSTNLMPAIMREDHSQWIEEPVGGHGRTFNSTEHYSKYKSGYPVAIAPFVAMGWWLSSDLRLWAIASSLLFGAVITWQMYLLLRRDLELSPSASALGAASIMYAFPLLSYGTQVYPEMFAGMLVVISLRYIVSWKTATAWDGLAHGFFLGWLFFQHDRFGFYGLPAVASYFWLTRKSARKVWAPFFLILAFFLGVLLFDQWARHFPIIPKIDQYLRTHSYWNLKGVHIGWFGAILDKAHGGLAYAPVLLMAPAFIVGAAYYRPLYAIPLAALMAIPYFIVLGYEEWWAGTSPPGRYLIAYYPSLAMFAGMFWQTRPARWVYWLFFLLLGTGLVATHNFYLYAKDDLLVHECYLDRRLPALDLSRLLYDFIRDMDLFAKTSVWALVFAALTAAIIRWKNERVSPAKFALSAGLAMALTIGGFYALFSQKPRGFAEKQRDSFGLPKKGEWMLWSSAGGDVQAVTPSEFLPRVAFEELENGWVRLEPGVKFNNLMIYGVYLKFPPGKYQVEIPVNAVGGKGDETVFIEVVDVKEGAVLAPGATYPLKDKVMAEFTIDRPMMNVEPRLSFESSVQVDFGPMKITGRAL